MGYRSDVRILVSKKGFEELRKFVLKEIENYNLSEDGDYDYNLLNHATIHLNKTRTQVQLDWSWLKWYDGYKDVDAIMHGLDFLDEKGYGYRFCRIGENMDDIEEVSVDGDNDDEELDYVCVSRSFENSYEDFGFKVEYNDL